MGFKWLRYASNFLESLNEHCSINKKLGYENEIGKCSDDKIWEGEVLKMILGGEHKNGKCSLLL